ncbi:MGH1-like glycoside hydrolase domain-containing protein [Flavihumibacter sp. UBA7668]|uniref:MGH1-like glycoside hydrolase domain-containing protein n=1 Tax=Flavihumibacter sp. UBA7668 TaxID=1946542 RepID=UPI0025C5736C|nr:trehalase family glycosidase [Flavihumibacter sp. UBA7668]
MDSRRKFIRNSFLLAGSAAIPTPGLLAGEKPTPSPDTDIELQNDFKNTYVKNIFVTENEFRNAKPAIVAAPSFAQAKEILPVPTWKGNQAALDMYWKAWEIAFKNIKDPAPKSGFIASYIDTAYNGNIFMWDSTFITMFARYGSRAYPFQQTLDNFYGKQHPDGFICREIWGLTGKDCFHRYDPTSTGPNLIPWSELEYYRQFGDLTRLHKIFPVLCAYYQWLRLNRTWQDGSYWSSGWGTGMDNQPRVHKEYNPIFSHGHMTWLDTCLQQLYIGKILVEFGFYVERWQEIEDIESETKALKKYIKEKLWDPKTNFLYDRYADGSIGDFKSIGAYWALWADILEPDELKKFVAHLNDPQTFARKHPIPSMPANHEKYQPDGRYWQGGVWAPTNFMVIAGLRQNNFHQQAFELAKKHHQQVLQVFKDTGTFWEYYAPETTAPGLLARPDFVGWTGLVPISILFEGIFGIKSSIQTNTINWDVRVLEEHGIDRYPIGKEGILSLQAAARTNEKQKPSLTIQSNLPLKLKLSWPGGNDTFDIKPGTNKI